jgi:CubicO group peptidase (beta-lactamase class C family)
MAAISAGLLACAGAAPSATLSPKSPPQVDVRKLRTLVDAVVGRSMAAYHLAGVTVSVVQGGRIVMSKGYGYADVAGRVRVSPSRTLFHIGSVTKLFTATATMQLWERGALSIDRDIGTYLDFKIPRHSAKPITMAHLMTHTAGFEESFLGFVSSSRDLLPLRDVTARTIPNVRLVREPGVARSYSNHGVLLEGYVVERVARMPFADYIETEIMRPLDMSHSSVREPLAANLRNDLAKAYTFADGRFDRLPDDYINLAPAGSISSTADDMASFMIAQLGGGRRANVSILQPATVAGMQSCQFMDHPLAQNCVGYGFFIEHVHGHRVLQHNGGTFSFLSNLVLVPDQDFGIFVSVNSPEDGGLTADLPKQVIAALFGHRALPLTTWTRPLKDEAADYAGYYVSMRRPYGGWLKLSGLGAAKVSATGKRTLLVEGSDSEWHQVGPAIFRSRHPDAVGVSLVFRRDANGRVVGASLGDGFDKVPWFATLNFALWLIGGFAIATAVFVSTLVACRAALLRRAGGLAIVTWPLVAGCIAFVVGTAIIAAYLVNEQAVRGYAQPFGAHVAVLCFDAMAAFFAFGLVQAVRNRRLFLRQSPVARAAVGGFAVAAVTLTLFMRYWELVALHA